MELNWMAILVASLVPMLVGAIYYNPKVLGTAWMNATGMTEEKAKTANMAKVFGVAFLFALMMAFVMNSVVIHQFSILGLFNVKGQDPSPDSEEGKLVTMFLEKYGTLHRTFTHGMVHGIIYALFLVLPAIGTGSLFEMRGWKYIMITVGYWIICMALMGGIICAWI